MALGSLGHYRLDERLGQGGMGEVFRAFDTRLNRRVAIKVMLRADGADATAVERFLREARAASALNHPNIVTIHEVGETPEGGYFIVQELVEGRTLRAMLADSLPLPTMLDIARQTARALAAAHAAGIVHRDIKPENIMVRGDGYVKVLDFGLARIVDVGGELSTTRTEVMTAPGTVIGTTPYMSPEQAHGDAPATPTDIFSLGVALYEMIGGKRPFVAPTALGVLAAIVGEQPVPLCRVQPTVPPEIDALVERMLAKPPHLRPTAREVEEALAAGTAGAVQSAAMSTRRSTVGRDAERAALALLYDQARAGRSRLVAVSGEAGIGKTSLIEDVLADLAARPDRPVVGRGRCSERRAGSEAFLPILDALDHLLHRGARESVRQVMKSVAPTWYAQVAAGAADESGLAQIREDVRAASPERMKRELAAFFADVSRVRPAVLFIDDLHWADVSTVDLLNYVTSRFDDMRLLIVATFRPAEMALAQRPFLAIKGDLLSRGVFEEIALRFLEPADVDRYLALEFPDHALPDDFAALVHEKTEGNPLFMADLVRYLRDSGAIMEDGGRFRLASDLPDLTRALPESVKGMIQRKIEQVDERDRKILIAASVQGHQFDAATVAEAVEMDPADVEERLEVLERVHVFVERGVEQEFPDLTLTLNYQFVHVLYQNILYSSLQPARRASLSGRVAKALVRHHGERVGPIAGRVAVLFEAARDFATSAQYYFMASQHAAGLHAFVEARALTERGLDAIRGLPEGPQRIQLELGLQMIRGLALRMMKGWAAPELEPVFTRARQLCHSLADPPELVPVLWALTLFYAIRGNLREYRERAEEVLRLAEQSGNPAFIMGGYHLVGVSGEFMGDMLESRRVLEQGIALHVPGEHLKYTAMYGLDPGMICRAMSSRPIWVLGYPDLAEARARETLALGRSQKQPMTLAFALLVMEGVHLYRGEPEKVIPLGDEVIQLAREFGLAQEKEWGRAFQASAFTQLGRLDEGIDQLKDSLAVQQAIGSGLVRTAFLALLADPLCRAGRIDEGLKAIDEGFTHAKTMSEGGYLAELHRMRGELLRKGGDRDGAETAYRAALAHAAAQQAKSFELRAATGLATLLLARNRRDEARAVLAPVHGWFTEGHDTLDLRAARAALVEIG